MGLVREMSLNETTSLKERKGIVFDIQRYAIHDGPGIRTLVFMKGCPLHCLWCCNPEGQRSIPELGYFLRICIKCGECKGTCPYGAISANENDMQTDRSVCEARCYDSVNAFPCTLTCYSKARRMVGEYMTVGAVLSEALRDYRVYKRTGGGITLSGGEPLSQPEFLLSLLQECKRSWLNTAIETCGLFAWENMVAALPYLDWIFFDLKCVNAEDHRKIAGKDNEIILENLVRLSGLIGDTNTALVIRVPVVPGYTDVMQNIDEISRFVAKNVSNARGIELLPYHRLGEAKYKTLGMQYLLSEIRPLKEEDITTLKHLVQANGVHYISF